MENTKQPANIPYFVHEAEMDRLERANRRWFVTALIIFLAFIGTNVYWIWYESQFQDQVVTETYTSTADGNSTAIANGDGSVTFYGGESDVHEDNPDAQAQNGR